MIYNFPFDHSSKMMKRKTDGTATGVERCRGKPGSSVGTECKQREAVMMMMIFFFFVPSSEL